MRNPKGKDAEEGDKVKDRIRGGGAAGRAHQFNLERGLDDDEAAQPDDSSSERSHGEKDQDERDNKSERSG